MATGAKISVIVADIRNAQLLADMLPGCDTVFHQAALRITHCAAEPRARIDVMIKATFDLVEQCQNERPQDFMASSASVYGMAEVFPTPEQHHPYNNRTFTGRPRRSAKALLRSFNDMYGTNYVCLRYFNVYGPRMDIHGRYTEVLVRWMERLENGEAPPIFGDGKQTMDMLHVRDVARANILSAISPASDVAINVGSGTETSLLALARHLAQVMGKPDLEPVHWEERAVNPVPRRLADTDLARSLIGFETHDSAASRSRRARRMVAQRAQELRKSKGGLSDPDRTAFDRQGGGGRRCGRRPFWLVDARSAGRRVRGGVCSADRRASRLRGFELHNSSPPWIAGRRRGAR